MKIPAVPLVFVLAATLAGWASDAAPRKKSMRSSGGRAESFETAELWQLAYIERLSAVSNGSTADLGRLGELALILGRFEDAGRLQSELLQRGAGPATWPAGFRAAVAAYFLEGGNAAAAASALAGAGSFQNLHPRARIKAAVIDSAVKLSRGNAAAALDALRTGPSENRTDDSLLRLQRARIQYEAGRLTEAMEELTGVPRSSPSWYASMMVSSWASYRAGDMNLSLGLLMGMHSPYLRNKFNPESYVLEAAALYRLCHYESALQSIRVLKTRYKNVVASLSRIERQIEARTDSVATVLAYAGSGSSAPWGVDPEAWDLISDGLLSEPMVAESGLSIEETEKAEAWLKSSRGAFGTNFGRELERARVEALKRVRRSMLAKAARMRRETNEAFENSLAIEVEVNTRIRDRLAKGTLPKFKDVDFDAEINRGYEFWPYQGEFWRDEAGSFVFATTDVCSSEREAQ